jgi:DNA-directed RNA polymerase specialized sigma24 family protein
MIKVIENKDRISSLNDDEVELYIYGTAWTTWHNKKQGRSKVKTHTAETSPFYSIGDNLNDLSGYIEHQRIDTLNQDEREVRIRLVKELNRLLVSDNQTTRTQGELLKAFCDGKNRLEISKELGLNYKTVHTSIKEATIKIKQNMGHDILNKTQINIKLRNEAINASYSGKDKTFYVSKEPNESLKKTIENSGFKVKTK